MHGLNLGCHVWQQTTFTGWSYRSSLLCQHLRCLSSWDCVGIQRFPGVWQGFLEASSEGRTRGDGRVIQALMEGCVGDWNGCNFLAALVSTAWKSCTSEVAGVFTETGFFSLRLYRFILMVQVKKLLLVGNGPRRRGMWVMWVMWDEGSRDVNSPKH